MPELKSEKIDKLYDSIDSIISNIEKLRNDISVIDNETFLERDFLGDAIVNLQKTKSAIEKAEKIEKPM